MDAAKKVEPTPLPYADYLRELLEANRLGDARRFVQERIAAGEPGLERLARLILPPKVTTSSYRPRSDFGLDNAWLRCAENREAYRGRWVAILNGKLLDSDTKMQPLVDRLVARGEAEGTRIG